MPMMCSGLALVDGEARVFVLQRDAEQFVERCIDGDRDNFHARRHDLARVHFLQFEQLLNRVFFEAFEMAFDPARFDDEFQLFR